MTEQQNRKVGWRWNAASRRSAPGFNHKVHPLPQLDVWNVFTRDNHRWVDLRRVLTRHWRPA